MKGIKFNKELGLLDMVLSGQKTSFRVVAKKRASDKILSSTKFKVNDRLAILQTYKDLNINPDEQLHVVENKVNIIKAAKDTKGWNLVSSVDPALMPHVIEITDVKTENIQDISDEDCRLEGIIPVDIDNLLALDGNMPFEGYSLDGKSWLANTPQEVFKAISDKAVKKDAWIKNNVVECYTFKLVR